MTSSHPHLPATRYRGHLDPGWADPGPTDRVRCTFVPPFLLQRLAEAGVDCAGTTLVLDRQARSARSNPNSPTAAVPGAWTVHTAANTTTLPGTPVRAAGQPASGDPAVDEAADGIAATLAMFADHLGRASYDGQGAGVSLTVHFGTDYDNAFWDGTQLVFGDGDGRVFGRFTAAVDVLAHEFTHALTEYTCGLVYQGQSGALNESVSDAFAACLKQQVLGQQAGEGDWLIGEHLFVPGIDARALRDMAAPGTAYDDPTLGKDPQVGHMDDYVTTSEDNGGVHLNSGIPNRAFQLAATSIGGASIDGAGAIWFRAMTSSQVRPDADFASFAAATVAAAGEHADAVTKAWRQVGVLPDGASGDADTFGATGRPDASGGAADTSGPGTITVRRSGGFAGRTTECSLDLDSDQPPAPHARALWGQVEQADVWPGAESRADVSARPDGFVYEISVPGRAPSYVGEQDLAGPLADLVHMVLSHRDR